MPLEINSALSIPDELLEVRYSRSGGPGGQNVNKVSSRVELFLDLARWTALPEDARQRLEAREKRRISREGVLRMVCQEYRDQTRNREECFEKLRQLVLECLVRPVQRRATKPSLHQTSRSRAV